ncbi:MAG: hypothetical protein ACI9OJ_003885 [Myxococcota bacterium]
MGGQRVSPMARPQPGPPDPSAVAAYRGGLGPDAPISLGVISNPFSRTNARSRLHDRLVPRVLPDRQNAIDTRTVRDLDNALETLLLNRGVNVLGLNGGDGTLHLGVNRLLKLARRIEASTGEVFPLPKLLFLNGGTLNIVSRATGTKGNPARTLREFVNGTRGGCLRDLHSRTLGLLEVEQGSSVPTEPPKTRYGFIFGTEVVANALEMYTLFGEGYPGLLRFLAEVSLGYTLNTRLWQEHGWKLDAPRTSITVDQVTYPRYLGAVCATIDLSILKGALTAIHVPEGAAGFYAKLMLETDPGKAIRTIPQLMIGAAPRTVRDIEQADELTMVGGYTLDGEVFLDRSPRGQRRPVTVKRGQITIEAVSVR